MLFFLASNQTRSPFLLACCMTDRTGHSDCQQSLGAGIWVDGLSCVSISVDLSGYAMVDKTTVMDSHNTE